MPNISNLHFRTGKAAKTGKETHLLGRHHKLIYFHGFGSSANSGTVDTLFRELPNFDVIAPDIPVDPADALPYLKELCEKEQPNIIVGTSMGGMYAQQMFGFKRICVNPAFEMSKKSKMLKVGTFKFFKPRLDDKTRFTITLEIIQHYADMEAHQFDGVTDSDRDNVWGLFGKNDNQVNCKNLFLQHYTHTIDFDGEHRLSDEAIKNVLVPLIRKLTMDEEVIRKANSLLKQMFENLGETKISLEDFLKDYCEAKVAPDYAFFKDWNDPRIEAGIPWAHVFASIDMYPEDVRFLDVECPDCGKPIVSLLYHYPAWATSSGMTGYKGDMTLCPHCVKQLDTCEISLFRNSE